MRVPNVRLAYLVGAAAVLGGIMLALYGVGTYTARFSSVDHLAGGPDHSYYVEVSRATVAERLLILCGAGLVLAGMITAVVAAIRTRRRRRLELSEEQNNG